jgi:hypothetical protein
MSWIATGVAVAGAAYSGIQGGKAAKAQGKAARRAFDYQNAKAEQARAGLAPYAATGVSANNAYARAVGLPQYDPMTQRYDRSGSINKDYRGIEDAYQQVLGRSATREEEKKWKKRTYEELLQGIRSSAEYQSAYEAGMLSDRETGKAAQQVDTDRYGGFEASPGYQFRLDEGGRAVDRSAAARGLLLSGAQNKASQRFGQDYASGDFQNYLANLGFQITGGQNAATNTANILTQSGRDGGQAIGALGDARAAGYLNKGQTVSNIGNAFSAGYSGRSGINPTGNNVRQSGYGSGYRTNTFSGDLVNQGDDLITRRMLGLN